MGHPVQFTQGIAQKTIRFFNSREMPRNIDIYSQRQWSPLLGITTWTFLGFGFPFGLLLPLCLVGLLWNIRRIPMPIIACLIIYPPVIILYFVSARYRLLCIPAMILVAATGISVLYDDFKRRETRKIAISFGIILCSILITSFPREFQEETINYEAEMYRSIGYQCMEQQDFEVAIPYLEQALTLDNELVSALNDLSMSLVETGDPRQAMMLSKRALQLNPNESGLHYNNGLICLENNLPIEAEQRFRRAIVLDPDNLLALEMIERIQQAR